MGVYGLEVGNDLQAALRVAMERLRPTPSFRRRAWREFQRALDPLARPKALPPAPPSGSGGFPRARLN
jgi:hypothetical protein